MGQDLLTPNQRRLLERAAGDHVITDAYYLTGGTALMAFYLGHRISEDLDFFTETPIDHTIIADWAKQTKKTLGADVSFQTLRGQYIYYFHFPQDVVKVDFAYFPFPTTGTYSKFGRLRIASLEDIGVNKLQAILSRSRGRDYVDLFEILQQPTVTVSSLTTQYRIKFDTTIPPEELAKHFQGVVDATDMPRFLGKRNWQEVETFFLTEANKLQQHILQ